MLASTASPTSAERLPAGSSNPNGLQICTASTDRQVRVVTALPEFPELSLWKTLPSPKGAGRIAWYPLPPLLAFLSFAPVGYHSPQSITTVRPPGTINSCRQLGYHAPANASVQVWAPSASREPVSPPQPVSVFLTQLGKKAAAVVTWYQFNSSPGVSSTRGGKLKRCTSRPPPGKHREEARPSPYLEGCTAAVKWGSRQEMNRSPSAYYYLQVLRKSTTCKTHDAGNQERKSAEPKEQTDVSFRLYVGLLRDSAITPRGGSTCASA